MNSDQPAASEEDGKRPADDASERAVPMEVDRDGDQEGPEGEKDEDDALDSSLLADAERYRQWRTESLGDLSGTIMTEAGRDWIGRITNQVSGEGAINHAGRDVHITYGGDTPAPPTYIPRSWAAEMLACVVEPPSLTRLSQYLENRDLVYLAGPESSGRATVAIVALLRWSRGRGRSVTGDEECVGVIRGRGALAAASLPKLRPGGGYLLDWDTPDWLRDAGHLQDLAMRGKARLVVLIPQTRTDVRGLIVEHRSPPAIQVFHRRLEYETRANGVDPRLPDKAREWVERELQGECLPHRAADMASRFANGMNTGQPFDEIIRDHPNALYGQVRDRLSRERPILGRCFTVAAAVLNDQPEVTVSQAAIDLAERIDSAWGVKDEHREYPIWEQLCGWLEHADASVRSVSPGDGRIVRLNRKGAADVVLKVIWEEHAAIREPLIEWLLHLGRHAGEEARVRVAHAAGALARFDFDIIDERLIGHWSGSRRVRDHRLAALALEAAAQEVRMRPRVHARLRMLARQPGYGPRSVAAQAYGFGVGIGIDEALRELRQLSSPLTVRLNMKVALSIRYLYRPDTAETVLRELARWVDDGSGGGRYTAALAFERLAALPAGEPAPDQLNLPEELALLWRAALTLRFAPRGGALPRPVAVQAWDVFGSWLARYEQPVTRTVVDRLIHDLEFDHLVLCLHLWRRKELISKELHDHLLRLAKEGR